MSVLNGWTTAKHESTLSPIWERMGLSRSLDSLSSFLALDLLFFRLIMGSGSRQGVIPSMKQVKPRPRTVHGQYI